MSEVNGGGEMGVALGTSPVSGSKRSRIGQREKLSCDEVALKTSQRPRGALESEGFSELSCLESREQDLYISSRTSHWMQDAFREGLDLGKASLPG